jgi:hypothetical protein
MPRFYPLLQQGVALKVRVGCSVKDLLCEQFGLSNEYIEKRIQTLFLEGKPLDNINSTVIQDGSILALSAAMPGLAGATLRRGGFFAPMRSQISFGGVVEGGSSKKGMITLKLFNLLIKELGPFFLERGVWIKGDRLKEFLGKQPASFWLGTRTMIVDRKAIESSELQDIKWNKRWILLKLEFDN